MPFADPANLRWSGPLGAILLAACVAKHRAIDAGELSLAGVSALQCPVTLLEVRDSVGPRTLLGPGGTYEVEGLAELIQSQVQAWEPAPQAAGAALELTLDLVRAYSEMKGDRTYFHTVLVATTPNGERAVLRGGHRQLNWWGTQAEFVRVFERSVDDALLQLHLWLEGRCQV